MFTFLCAKLSLNLLIDVLLGKWGAMFGPSGIVMDSSRENARRSIDGALSRLQIPMIDLFTLRGPVTAVPIEETMEELKLLVSEGKIRCIGLSESNSDTIRRAHKVCKVSAVEIEWSLFTRDAEKDIVPTCRELGIAILAYSPLGRGMLTGTIQNH